MLISPILFTRTQINSKKNKETTFGSLFRLVTEKKKEKKQKLQWQL